MNGKKRIKILMNQTKQALRMGDNVKLVLYPMKYKLASVSLKTRTIRLNKNLISILDDEELHYILAHELIHIKIMSFSHGENFYHILNTLYPLEKSEEIENRIIKKLMETGINTKGWLT